MDSHCISFREIPQTTKLFSSFLYDFQRVSKYYAYPPTEQGVVAGARDAQIPPEVRQKVAAVLREQNARFGASDDTSQNIARLEAGAVAIVTGQQVGLFGGAAFSIYKALSAIRCAEELTLRGIPAVPVFWLATEDHDLAEVNHCFFNTRSGLRSFELPAKDADAGLRVGEVALGDGIHEVVGAAVEALEGAASEEVIRALRAAYTPQETYGSAFGKLLARLLDGRGLIFIDPLDDRLHRLALPVYQRAAEDAKALQEALLARSNELDRTGFHAQVKVTRETTLLFLNRDGQRLPVRSHNGNFIAGKQSYTHEEFLALIEQHPLDVTPNALLRPVVQDTLLPTAAYIGGPSEIAYMAQTQVAYEKILGRMPAILPRASFTIVEQPMAQFMGKYGLRIEDFFRGRQHVRTRMEQESLPEDLAQRFEDDERDLRAMMDAYANEFEKLDASLTGALRSAEGKMLYQFAKLKTKAGRAEGFRTGVLDRHERILLDSIFPRRELQERTPSALPFIASYGTELLDQLTQLSATFAANSDAPAGSACAYQHHVVVL